MSAFPFSNSSSFIRVLRHRLSAGLSQPRECLSAGNLAALVNSMYSASQLRVEDHPVRPRAAVTTPDEIFVEPYFGLVPAIQCCAKNLAMLAASFQSEDTYIVVTPKRNGPVISGFCLGKPSFVLTIDVLRPGALVLRLDNVVVAAVQPSGEHFVFEDESPPEDLFHEAIYLNTRLAKVPEDHFLAWKLPWVVSLLAQSMRQHGRGGCVLFTNSDPSTLSSSLSIAYTLGVGSDYLSTRVREFRSFALRYRPGKREKHQMQEFEKATRLPALTYLPDSKPERRLAHALRFVGGLTAVDGAVVLGRDLKIHGYGAKIRTAAAPPDTIIEVEYVSRRTSKFDSLGGMRHRSAAQFVFEHPTAAALVVSQDGPVTFFAWDSGEVDLLAVRGELLVVGTYEQHATEA